MVEAVRKKLKGNINDNTNLRELVELVKVEKKLTPQQILYLNVFLRTEVEADYGAIIDQLSAKYFDYADVNDGDDFVFTNGNYNHGMV